MTAMLIGKALSPFFVLLLAWLITNPVRVVIERRMRDGKLKRALLARVN